MAIHMPATISTARNKFVSGVSRNIRVLNVQMATFCTPLVSRSFKQNGSGRATHRRPEHEVNGQTGKMSSLRNHSRERGPYISKLLDDACNDIWLCTAFPKE